MFAEKREHQVGLSEATYARDHLDRAVAHANNEVLEVFLPLDSRGHLLAELDGEAIVFRICGIYLSFLEY